MTFSKRRGSIHNAGGERWWSAGRGFGEGNREGEEVRKRETSEERCRVTARPAPSTSNRAARDKQEVAPGGGSAATQIVLLEEDKNLNFSPKPPRNF